MKNKNFVAFIMSHGRADNVITLKSLKKCGYTGDIIILIDNEDKTADEYYKNFGDNVQMFDKAKMAEKFDEADNFRDRRAIVYARNACFEVAKNMGYKYFIELDDDYTTFSFSFNKNMEYGGQKRINDLDSIFDIMIDCLNSSPKISTIAMAQGGDFIGGEGSSVWKKKVARKAMNSFVCDIDKPFKFIGRINEDVNTYTSEASKGLLMFTTALLRLEQKQTQSNSGGMTDIYLDNGTYIKSFYTVIFQPSSVSIRLMGNTNKRLHHSVNWELTVPKILSDEYKKR